jgi:hypothetical protein
MKEASITSIATQRRARASGSLGVAEGPTVRVPVWVTTAQALRVAELKRVDRVHVEDRGLVRGSISRQLLATAPAHDLVARWFDRDTIAATPANDQGTSHAA